MSISKPEHDELCCVFAGIILSDEGIEITLDKIKNIIKASGNEVDNYYPEFFVKYLSKSDLKSMLTIKQINDSDNKIEEYNNKKYEIKKDEKKDEKKDNKKIEKNKPIDRDVDDEDDEEYSFV